MIKKLHTLNFAVCDSDEPMAVPTDVMFRVDHRHTLIAYLAALKISLRKEESGARQTSSWRIGLSIDQLNMSRGVSDVQIMTFLYGEYKGHTNVMTRMSRLEVFKR